MENADDHDRAAARPSATPAPAADTDPPVGPGAVLAGTLEPATELPAPAAPAAATPTSAERHGDISVVTGERVTHVELSGDIDVLLKDELFDALEAAARPGLPVEIDCSAVRFIDSTGLSALAWLANLAPEPPRLLGVPSTVRELLSLTGIQAAFSFAPREAAAG